MLEKQSIEGYYTCMKEMTLTDYLIDGTLAEVATALTITPGAVHQMVKHNRDVRLILNNKNKIVRAHEIKQLPPKHLAVSNG